MQQVIDFFSGLLDTSNWPPRWHCGIWTEFHGWLYIISDLLVFSAYFAIPVIIVRYIATRTNARFHKIYFLFAAFILACGFTHLLDALTFWYPVYRLSALVRFITGVISWATVYYLIRLLPTAFSLKTADELEVEVEQRRKVENDLSIKVQLLNEAQEIARLGHWEWNVVSNIVTWSDNLYRIFNVTNDGQPLSYEFFLSHTLPEDHAYVDGLIRQAFEDKKFPTYYHRIKTADGAAKTILANGEVIVDEQGTIIKMIGTAQDVTEQKLIEQELRLKTAELEIKNAELEKFAYVASHDLQEPLRKIMTFISRLQDENTQLEGNSAVYLEKIDNAAFRMKNLIHDILSYSQIATATTQQFEQVNLGKTLATVLNDMEVQIESTQAVVSANGLPVIEANATQVQQLLQNIIANAIKFRSAGLAPVIDIKTQIINGADIASPDYIKAHYKFANSKDDRLWAKEQFCRIVIADNGIGFESQYATRIFETFQRLEKIHEGTGIGLAICKKITENHHGHIYAESEPGAGAKFTIILPVSQRNFE